MNNQATNRRTDTFLSVLLVVTLVVMFVVLGCHMHLPTESSSFETHCVLCDLAILAVAVVVFALALTRLRLARRVCEEASPSLCSLVARWLYIRPPPVLLEA